MKKLFLSAITLIVLQTLATAQQGKILYDRTVKLQFSFAGMPGGMEQQVPQSRTDKFELSYGNRYGNRRSRSNRRMPLFPQKEAHK
jgi:hypothetical protein